MPSCMTHLMAARKVRPDGSTLFFLGSIAPDATVDWHDKDITHFRNLEDRRPALEALARETAGDFAEGVLLHLYVDWQWDTTVRQAYIERTGADWFVPYRRELSLSSGHAFHQSGWAQQVWRDIDAIDPGSYGATPRAEVEDVKRFVSRNHIWHIENCTEASQAFPPDLIEDFAAQTAQAYVAWRASYLKQP